MSRTTLGGVIIAISFAWIGFYAGSNSSPDGKSAKLACVALQNVGGVDSYGSPVSNYRTDGTHIYYQLSDGPNLEIIPGALASMKVDIKYLYAKDAYGVFYEGKRLDANPTTFVPIENGAGVHSYGTDGIRVFYGSETIQGADPQTFEALWETIYEGCGKTEYSRDAGKVYWKDAVVPGADASTFESLIHGYGRDKRGYYQGTGYIGPSLDQDKLLCNYG